MRRWQTVSTAHAHRRADHAENVIAARPRPAYLRTRILVDSVDAKGCPMTKTLPISDVKTHLPELVTGVDEREEEVIVTRKGKPAAVLVNIREYERLKATVDVLSDSDLMDQIRRSRRYFARGGKGRTIEQVFGPAPRKPHKPRKASR